MYDIIISFLSGQPEHVVNFFFMIAEDIRRIMANLGIAKFQDMIGRTDLLKRFDNTLNDKADLLQFDAILKSALELRPNTNIIGGSVSQDFKLSSRLEEKVILDCKDVLEGKRQKIQMNLKINNEERTFGATLSYYISLKYHETGMEDDSIDLRLTGSAGQSFGAFLQKGISLTLAGDANDYVGKGLSGGKICIFPPKSSPFKSEENVIIGNVALYGATSGKAYFRGIAAERFCVRNSGATAVVEGVGDHGCEYMTGKYSVLPTLQTWAA